MDGRVAGLPSQRPGKQEEKVAKPPVGGDTEGSSGGWPAGAGESSSALSHTLQTPKPSLPLAQHLDSCWQATCSSLQHWGCAAAHLEQAPTPTFLLKLIRDWLRGTALMPINVGSRWPVSVAYQSQAGDGLDRIRGLLFPSMTW